MGILDWLFQVERNVKATAETPMDFDKGEEDFHGLNMKAAIDAHRQWKDRLEKAVAGTSTETLDVARVSADHHCALGQWLHSEAKKRFGQTSEYRQLLKDHAEFHLMAGEIACDARAGEAELAAEKLKTTFRRCSDRVILDVVRLYARCK